jgi:hypothetical protein
MTEEIIETSDEVVKEVIPLPDQFRNGTLYKFRDISSEVCRQYRFPNGTVRIDNPLKLAVSESGGHRIYAADGVSRYIPAGWLCIEWLVKDGEPHFSY